ncbi:glutamine synthetase family protein [Streptomyces sp. NPDC005811]|uniref:glutamine synthetase family protein n=1 Tax=Streptomyces sp. NPDC005811 TaxID=3154565 RepID=UPI00340353F2
MGNNHPSASSEEIAKVRATLEERGIKRVLVGGADVHGQFRAKFIPAWRFAKDPAAPIHISDVIAILDIEDEMIPRPAGYEGWWPTWDSGFEDMECVPDLSTFTPVPWIEDGAMVLVDFRDHGGRPVRALPRNVLRNVVDRATGLGFTPRMAGEYEFFVFRETAKTAREKGFRDLATLGEGATMYGGERAHADLGLIGAMEQACESIGIKIEAAVTEGGPSQYELNLTPQSALRAADEGFLFKFVVKRMAESLGHTATFIPKLGAGGFGSSMHAHQSLWAGERNVFFDAKAPHGLSVTARQYAAGMMRTLREFTAVYAPFVLSYKRFEGGAETAAGSKVTWAVDNRTTAVRAVCGPEAHTRLELRTPGADANSYLAFAAMLAGGLWGIENDIDPGEPYIGNAYADPAVDTVPATLGEALELFEQSEVANKYFGEDVVRYYTETRRWEVEQFNSAVTDWELGRYFGNV